MSKDRLYKGPIFVKKSSMHGYGVFAAEDLVKDTIIEECYTLFTPTDHPEFMNYYFEKNEKSALALGYGSIYNHSGTPNVAARCDNNLFIFFTLRAIRQGEELCIFYGDSWFPFRELKVRTIPWWHRAYRLSKGIMLRAFLIYGGYLAFILGIKYLSS